MNVSNNPPTTTGQPLTEDTQNTQKGEKTQSPGGFWEDLKNKLDGFKDHLGGILQGLEAKIKEEGPELMAFFKERVEPLLGQFAKIMMSLLENPQTRTQLLSILLSMLQGKEPPKDGLEDILKIFLSLLAKAAAMLAQEHDVSIDPKTLNSGDAKDILEQLATALGQAAGTKILELLQQAIDNKLPGLGGPITEGIEKILQALLGSHRGLLGNHAGQETPGSSSHPAYKVAI